MSASTNAADTSWLLGTIPKLKGVRHTLLATSDGLVKAHCENTSRDMAERMAAAVSGTQSLSRAVATEFGPEGAVPLHSAQTFTGGVMFMRPAAGGSVLIVVTDAQADPGTVAQFMAQQVQQLGRNLATPGRTPDPAHD